MITYLLERAKEPSSWRGAVLLATAAGVGVTPELANAIISVGVSLAGLLGIFTKG